MVMGLGGPEGIPAGVRAEVSWAGRGEGQGVSASAAGVARVHWV